jgi:hypothetical protein
VPPTAPIQHQIEAGIETATGERVAWPELVRSAGDVVRVVILDGLDELIQSSQVSRSDYLELVQDFQRREVSLGRGTAVIVTSRTAVASRTRFPDRTIAIRLEPFTSSQVTQWLSVWNNTNRTYFQTSSLKPLSPASALRFRSLAIQPLLLTMLALYDADDNALLKQEMLDTGKLYEELLTSFARREIRTRGYEKREIGSEEQLRTATEWELRRLAVTAVGMFNRGRQWISADELNSDLAHFMPADREAEPRSATFHEALTPAEYAVGRFFFIHESHSSGDRRSITYEFLHATFGEYLFARFIRLALLDFRERHRLGEAAFALPATAPDDGLLFALLSFDLLTARQTIVDFLSYQFRSAGGAEIDDLRLLLIRTFRRALFGVQYRSYQDYEPISLTTVHRHASYSANLFLILAYALDVPFEIERLFVTGEDTSEIWRQHLGLWWTQFAASQAWAGLNLWKQLS